MAKKLLSLLGVAMLLPLAGCITSVRDIDFYDNGSTDADRFVEQTTPVWNRRRVVTTQVVYEADSDYPLVKKN
ncbi:hypothetical protein [Rhizobium alvei]|jgi:hypothetical protein|uniref:Lipoprotein n=1 Tax=Rhizobium alvei TaxID=1132659 RepID=A0ABT8YIF5_9HYPH|nr:hypothetical protein [Rhizobium alvei]MDO6963478.1 hypothetical protein [Rhizobium alvei]